MDDRLSALQQVVAQRSRGRMELLAHALSPDRRWAAVLMRARPSGYQLESLYEWADGGWLEFTTSNGGISWTATGDTGVLRVYGEAPPGTTTVRLQARGRVHEVPVTNGHFAFAIRDASDDEIDAPLDVVG